MKNHTGSVVAMYTLLILTAPFVLSSVPNVEAVICPAGYICTPISAVNVIQPVVQPVVQAPVVSSPGLVSKCFNFKANLMVGSRGNDVSDLQKFLVSKVRNMPITGYFGNITATVLAQYQSEIGAHSESGYLGPITRTKINALCGYNNPINGGVTIATSSIIHRPLVCGSKGDLNSDGFISSVDYDLLGQVVVGNITSTLERGDINGDGEIDGGDWVQFGRYVNSLTNTFTGCVAIVPPATPVVPPIVTPIVTPVVLTQLCGGVSPTMNNYTSLGNQRYQVGSSDSTTWTYVASNPAACQYSCVNGGINNSTSCSAPTTARPLVCGTKGDLNSDGSISSADYDLLGQVVVGNITSTLEKGDINGDGEIDGGDWVQLGRYVNSLSNTFIGCPAPTSMNTSPYSAAIIDAINEWNKTH